MKGLTCPKPLWRWCCPVDGSVREHVQRLGRVLRKKADKRALLYELVTGGTTETSTSFRRREHVLTADLVQTHRRGDRIYIKSMAARIVLGWRRPPRR